MKIQSEFDGLEREVNIQPGKTYQVEPLNPRKSKHRGRVGMLTLLEKGAPPSRGWFFIYRAKISVLVDLADLVEVPYPNEVIYA